MTKTAAIEVRQLQKAYQDNTVLRDVTFTVEPGSIFVLVGPNGAGKTTTVECMEGLRIPDRGTVSVLGMNPLRDRRNLFKSVGVQLQENNLHPRQKVKEVLNVFSSFYENPVPYKELLAKCGLEGRENEYYGKLSGGQKRRLLLVLALLGNPKLVILDEPTSGLDPQARYNVWKLLTDVRSRGTTVFLTTHQLHEAEEYADQICMIDEGKVVAMGKPKALLEEYGLEVCIKMPASAKLHRDMLQAVPGVRQVEMADGQVYVYGTGKDLFLNVSRLMESKGLSTEYLENRRATLEDLYLLITGRAYRKE